MIRSKSFVNLRDTGVILNAIGQTWFEILEKIKEKNLLYDLKVEISKNNYTLIAGYVGLKLVKYPKRLIIFHSIVDNNSEETCIPITSSYPIFEKYGLLISPIDKLSESIYSPVCFNNIMKKFFQVISSSSISNEEEGSVETYFTLDC